MVVSFLQNQLENKKSIKIADGNIGRLFLEFLWHYGIFFDHTKYVIYAYPPNEAMSDKESINFLYVFLIFYICLEYAGCSRINHCRSSEQK